MLIESPYLVYDQEGGDADISMIQLFLHIVKTNKNNNKSTSRKRMQPEYHIAFK